MEPGNSYIVVIGHNKYGELGLSHDEDVNQLQYITNAMKIKHIHTGYRFTILCDESQNYFVCGCNENGECGVDNQMKTILKLTKIDYFNRNNIIIKRVFTDTRGSGIFWLSTDNKVYAHGSNHLLKLGFSKDNTDYFKPHHTKTLPLNHKVIDIRTAFGYTIILCHNPTHIDLIVNGWLRNNIQCIIPIDLILITKLFYGILSTLYATVKSGDGGNGLGDHAFPLWRHNVDNIYWKHIETLSNTQIVKIRTGSAHSLFLDIFGRVYSCGWNRFGQLGLTHTKNEYIPKVIQYFVENRIEIRDIQCGSRHNLAIDTKHNVYSWGNNAARQCQPNSNKQQFNAPTLVSACGNYKIKRIECGAWHSCVVTDDHKYFLFGSTQHNMCAVSDDGINGISLINDKICTLLDNDDAEIVNVYLGWNNTHIIVSDKDSNILKQTKDQIQCSDDVMAETMMGYEINDQLLVFNDEDGNNEEKSDHMEGSGSQNSVTLMGSITNVNERIGFNDVNESDDDNNVNSKKSETLLGYTNCGQ